MAKKKPKKIPMCFVCFLKPRMGKCLICGYSIALKDIDPHWRNRHEWLQTMYKALRRFKQPSTRDYKTDFAIAYKFGSWGSGIELVRDPFTRQLIELKYPSDFKINRDEKGRIISIEAPKGGDEEFYQMMRSK